MTELVGIASGVEIGGYRVEEMIGRGGMGEVYRAHDGRLDRDVALKILAPRYADDDAFRERLHRESRLAAGLDQPSTSSRYTTRARPTGASSWRCAMSRAPTCVRFCEAKARSLRNVQSTSQRRSPERWTLLRERSRPPRRQAVERPHRRAGALLPRRLRADTQRVVARAGAGRIAPRNARLRRSGADPRRRRRRPRRCVLAGLPAFRVSHRRGAVRSTLGGRDAVRAPGGRAASAEASGVPGFPGGTRRCAGRAMAKDPDERQPTCAALVAEARVALGLVEASPQSAAASGRGVGFRARRSRGRSHRRRAHARSGADSDGRLADQDRPTERQRDRPLPRLGAPGVITTLSGRVWLGDYPDGALWTLEPGTGELKRVVSLGEPRDLTALGGKIYVAADSAGSFTGTVTRYDAVTGVRARTFSICSPARLPEERASSGRAGTPMSTS